MDKNRKRELLEEYKNRKPEMGIVAIYCIPTDEIFLGIAKDTRAIINSHSVKLAYDYHPNSYLQGLWNTYGKEQFKISVHEVLPYDEVTEDYTDDLEALLELCLSQVENGHYIKRPIRR